MNTRRQILKATGAGIVVSLAGCGELDYGEEAKETPVGDSGDITDKHWKEVFSHSGEVSFEYIETDDGTYARATVEAVNESKQMVTFAEIMVYAYDVDGKRVDSVELTAQEWKPGAPRAFEIEAGPGSYNDMIAEYDRAEIVDIDFKA